MEGTSESMNPEFLEEIKNRIECMDKYHQIEILKILSDNNSKINENKSGVFVNLSFLSKNAILQMKNYIDYIKDQEDSLVTLEHQKKEYQNTFFIENGDKDNTTISYSAANYNK